MKNTCLHDHVASRLASEIRWQYGEVPHGIAGVHVPPGFRCIADGCFLLRCESGYGYLYEPGRGITIERPPNADPDEEILWLNGSVYAGVACLNGFLPFHASAVAHEGRVFAFTGPAGAGKSTLAAGLGRFGFPLFCDDTLLVDLSIADQVLAMPGHKRLKLREDALAMTGATAVQPVGAETGKHYAEPLAGSIAQSLPFDTLVFLHEGPELTWEPITGAARFAMLEDDHHTQEIYAEAVRPTLAEQFSMRARLAGQLRMARLVRPRSTAGFEASLAFVADRIREDAA